MTEQQTFLLADRALNSVVDAIGDDQWDMDMPATFVRRGADKAPTLREIINYHAYDDAWVPDMLTGATMEEIGKEKFQGDLLGDDPKASFASIVELACASVELFDDLDRTMHLSFGDFSAREYFWQISQFRGLRAWDISLVIGFDVVMPDALVQGMWDEVAPHAEEWRSYGVFPPAIPIADDAPLLDRLLGLTGRPPR